MDRQRALELVQGQIGVLETLRYVENNPQFDKWQRDTRVVLENIFGAESRHVEEFKSIHFWSRILGRDHEENQQRDRKAFDVGKSEAKAFLLSVITEIEQFGDALPAPGRSVADPLVLMRTLCGRFHHVVRQLRDRHDNRTTIEIEDEYDVQDLLHSLLKIHFDDVRPEEWTPSYAGKSARMDFLLKDCQIVLEAKKTRKGLGEKEVGDELLIDIARYRAHPDCKTLVCFIYDPEGRIGNPTGMETDLSGERDKLKVIAIVNPK
jgi:hypothetical protein